VSDDTGTDGHGPDHPDVTNGERTERVPCRRHETGRGPTSTDTSRAVGATESVDGGARFDVTGPDPDSADPVRSASTGTAGAPGVNDLDGSGDPTDADDPDGDGQ
jgi:hypothetical protein